MGKINYENKVALNENPAIQNINKVTDSDMNEIKESVNYIYDKGLFEVTPNEPTDEYIKLWIDNGEISPAYSEVVNSLDGNETAKAPSVQAVNNKFNGLIKTGYISVQAKRGLANPITAIVPDGYEFLCWLQPASQGSVLTAYIQDTLSPSTNIWLTSGEENVNYNFGCTYLVIKTGMKG